MECLMITIIQTLKTRDAIDYFSAFNYTHKTNFFALKLFNYNNSQQRKKLLWKRALKQIKT